MVLAASSLFGQDPVNVCAQVDQDGQNIEVNIYVQKFSNIAGMQFGIAWENSKYTFEAFENVDPSIASIAFSNITQDTPNLPDQLELVNIVWIDNTGVNPITLDDGTLLFTVELTQNDPNVSGLIGIAQPDDFGIEFISADVSLLPFEIEGPDCAVLAFASVLSTNDIIINKLAVSPNPIEDELTISLEETSNGTFSVYAVSGKLMEQFDYKNKQEVTFSLESLAPGTYILTQQSEDGKILGQSKIVKL